MKFSKTTWLYLTFAVAGLVLTWYFNIRHVMAGGSLLLPEFVAHAFANHVSSSVAVDITVVAFAFFVWMFSEAKRLGIRWPFVYVILTIFVALAFAFPLFLAVRAHVIEKAGRITTSGSGDALSGGRA
ncbi:DUF2834 domain-containing protein [Noviherbaspirillum cavernae]|nr:DUF2834 domain-containing protein [Noviherbaspirillum cavernae]